MFVLTFSLVDILNGYHMYNFVSQHCHVWPHTSSYQNLLFTCRTKQSVQFWFLQLEKEICINLLLFISLRFLYMSESTEKFVHWGSTLWEDWASNNPWEYEVSKDCLERFGGASWFFWFSSIHFPSCWNETSSFPQCSFPWNYWRYFLLWCSPSSSQNRCRLKFKLSSAQGLSDQENTWAGEVIDPGGEPKTVIFLYQHRFLLYFKYIPVCPPTGKCSSMARAVVIYP